MLGDASRDEFSILVDGGLATEEDQAGDLDGVREDVWVLPILVTVDFLNRHAY